MDIDFSSRPVSITLLPMLLGKFAEAICSVENVELLGARRRCVCACVRVRMYV